MISRRSQAIGVILWLGIAGTAPAQAPAAGAATWGTLRGRVVFRGEPPGRNLIFHRGEAPPGRDGPLILGGEPLFDERWVVDPKSRGVKNVLVYLPRPTAVRDSAREAATKAVPTFVLASGRFDPHVLPVMAGGKVEVRTPDPIAYYIRGGGTEPPINQMVRPLGSQLLAIKSAPGTRRPFSVRDPTHSWMRSYWYVAENPYFAVTDAEGRFAIRDVPAGPQRVVAWHEAVGRVTAGKAEGEEVAIAAGGTTDREFTIDEERARPDR